MIIYNSQHFLKLIFMIYMHLNYSIKPPINSQKLYKSHANSAFIKFQIPNKIQLNCETKAPTKKQLYG